MVDVCQEGDEDECRDQAKGHHAASWPRSLLASIVDKQGDSQSALDLAFAALASGA